jgi:hypothetical protein
MKKKHSKSQSGQNYEPATSANLFLDRKGHENEWEPEYLQKISDYYKNMGLMKEQNLPIRKDLYGGLENAIKNSGFHLEDNEFADFYGNLEQTGAARTLNRALNTYFKSLKIPIKFAVVSIDESSFGDKIPKLQNDQHPNRFVVAASAAQDAKGKGVIYLYAVVAEEDFDSSLSNPTAMARNAATVIRHEMIHDRQYDSLAKSMGISRTAAKKKFEEWGLIPSEDAPRSRYLGSHIEVDAFGHEFAERLAQKFGLVRAEEMVSSADATTMQALANEMDAEMSDNFSEYYKDHPEEKFTRRLQKKIRKNLRLFRDSSVYESVIFERVLRRLTELTHYDTLTDKIVIDIEDIEVIASSHGEDRRHRHLDQGQGRISKESILTAIDKAIGLIMNDYANGELANRERFHIVARQGKQPALNIIGELEMQKGPDVFKVVTVMRKDDFRTDFFGGGNQKTYEVRI